MNRKQRLWWIFTLLTAVNQLLTAQTCNVDGGIISPSGSTVICSGDERDDLIEITLTNNSGDNSLWILTDQNNIITSSGTSNQFNFEGFDAGVIIIYHVSHDGTVTFTEGMDLDNITGCYDLSNPISIIINAIEGGVIFDDLNTTVRTVCVDNGVTDLITLTLQDNSGNNSQWVFTDENGIITALPPAPPFSFEGEDPGVTNIYNITYNNISGLEEGLSLSDLTGCYDLSNAYLVRKSSGEVSGGIITTGSLRTFCSGDGKNDIVTISVTDNIGDNSRFIALNPSGEIITVQESSQFNFEGTKESQITIWHIAYNDGLRNLIPGNKFSDLQGCFGLSNFIEVNPEIVDGGFINNINGPNDLVFCTNDGILDMVAIQAGGSVGNIKRFVITDQHGDITSITSNTAFNFEGNEAGTTVIYNIAYNDVPQGLQLGSNIFNLQGCFALSNSIRVTRLSGTVNPITISTDDNTNLCTGDAFPDIVDVDLIGTPGSTGTWVITDADSTIRELHPSPPFDFSGDPPGTSLIFFIDYVEGTLGIEVGNKVTDLTGCFEISNGISIEKNGVNGGDLRLMSGDTSILICVGNSSPNILPLNLTGNFGSNSRWVVTEGEDSIILVSTSNQIDFNLTQPGSCKLWHISFEDGIIGLQIQGKLGELIGCYDLSNPIIIDKNEGNTFPGTIFTNDPTIVCVGEGSGDNIFFEELPGVGSISNWIVTDTGGKIVLIQLSRSIFMDDLPGGTCIVRNIRYEEGIRGLEVGGVITDIQGCFSLSNSISITKNEVNGGNLIANNGETDLVICKESNTSTIVELNVTGQIGDESRFLLTTPIGNILDVRSSSNFEFDDQQSDDYAIWHISYELGTRGIQVGGNINQINGCHDLSNPVSVSLQNIDGGNIQTIDGSTFVDICVGEGKTDLVEVLLDNVVGQRRSWILTDGSGLITNLPTGPVYNFENEDSGIVYIYNVSYNGQISNLGIGKRISDLSGCFDLSNPLIVSLSKVSAGNLRVAGNGSTIEICAEDGIRDLISFEVTDNEAPVTQLFSIDEEGDIREIYNGMEIDFTGMSQQHILISSISYYNVEGFRIGNNVQDIQGCFDISNTVTVIINNPKAGILTNDKGETMMEICVGEGITDFINIRVSSNVVGSQRRWFITDESGIIIENNRTPPFNFENTGSGTSRIYHVRYEGSLSGTAKGLNINTLSGCFNISNALTVIRKNVNASQIAFIDGTTEKSICLGDGYPFDFEFITVAGDGENQRWVVTDTMGTILQIQESAVFNFENAGEGISLIYQVHYNDEINGLEVGSEIDSLEGCFLTSNALTVIRKNVNASQIAYMDGTTEKTICLGDDYFFDIEFITVAGEGENQRWVVTDTFGTILDIQESGVFNFDDQEEGTSFIYQIHYNDAITGLETGRKIDSLEGCFLVSNALTILRVKDEACTTPTIEVEGEEYSVNIYPNPAYSEIYIHSDIPSKDILDVGIYDLTGKRVRRISPSLLNVPIDVVDFQSGIYFIGFNVKGHLHSFRFIKQ